MTDGTVRRGSRPRAPIVRYPGRVPVLVGVLGDGFLFESSADARLRRLGRRPRRSVPGQLWERVLESGEVA